MEPSQVQGAVFAGGFKGDVPCPQRLFRHIFLRRALTGTKVMAETGPAAMGRGLTAGLNLVDVGSLLKKKKNKGEKREKCVSRLRKPAETTVGCSIFTNRHPNRSRKSALAYNPRASPQEKPSDLEFLPAS